MKTVPTGIITQKNKLAAPGSWLTCIDIAYSGETTLHFVNNTRDVVLGATTYNKWAFALGQVK